MAITNKDQAGTLKFDTLPTRDDRLPLMWLAIKSIKSDVDSAHSKKGTGGSKWKQGWRHQRTSGWGTSDEGSHVEIINSIRQHQQHQIHKYIEGIKINSMRDNIIFSFNPDDVNYHEADWEDCCGLVSSFISDIMGFTANTYIQSAHRLGKKKSK